jgi:hypothetical protein
MRHIVLAPVAFGVMASVAVAQNMQTQSGPPNPAVKGMHDNNSATPVMGANSFTMSQAKAQIEAKGYNNVANLQKDQNGIWRGTAMKNGASGPVSVDYQGNVN